MQISSNQRRFVMPLRRRPSSSNVTRTSTLWLFMMSKVITPDLLISVLLICPDYDTSASLDVMPPQSSADYDLQLDNAVRDLNSFKEQFTTDAAFVYCKEDCAEGDSTIIQPKIVHQDLQNKGIKRSKFFPHLLSYNDCWNFNWKFHLFYLMVSVGLLMIWLK